MLLAQPGPKPPQPGPQPRPAEEPLTRPGQRPVEDPPDTGPVVPQNPDSPPAPEPPTRPGTTPIEDPPTAPDTIGVAAGRAQYRRQIMFKIVLSGIIVLAVTSTAFARCRAIAAGPEDYVDDNGCWHSIRSDWPNIQRAEASGQKQHPPGKHRDRAAREA
jgi:hypothetical protein